ncbi:MAG: phosphatase PAP2 family protein [Bacteroidota bacterium]
MRMRVFFAVFLTLSPYFLLGQSLQVNTADTLVQNSLVNTCPSKGNSASFRNATSYIYPASMLAFGFLANNSHPLRDFNESIQEEVWEMAPRRGTFEVEDYLQNVPVYSVFALNAVGVKGKNGTIDRIALYGISNLLMTQSVSRLKIWSGKLRPDGSDRRSFPSGHAANAFATAEFMRLEYKDVSPVYGLVAYGIAATTGAFRIYHNNHWFSDVVAGAGIGILSTHISYFTYPKIKKIVAKIVRTDDSNFRLAPIYQNRTTGLSVIFNPN